MNQASSHSKTLPFGVLDLCKRNEGQTTAEAISGVLNLAELADQLGYSRYWLAEHHVPYAISSAPELLLPLIAARTRRIRMGTGGMIIRYYSPYRVAEIATTLQTISAERFDLGLCRGPGVVDECIAEELVSGNSWELGKDAFVSKITRTANLIRVKANTHEQIRVYTPADTLPELWYLGASQDSLEIADKLHMSLAIPLFISQNEDKAFACNNIFKQSLAGEINPDRKSILAVSVVCADTDEKAIAQHKKMLGEGTIPSNFTGSYKHVSERLLGLLKRFEMDELLIASFSRDHSERMATYSLLAECCQ